MHEHRSHLSLLDRSQGKSLECFILKSPSLKWVMALGTRAGGVLGERQLCQPSEKNFSCELRWLTCPGRTIRRWNCSAYVSECRAGQRAGALGNSSGVNSFTLRKMYSDIALTGSPLGRDWPILGKKDRKQQQQWTLGQSLWVQLNLQSGGAVQVLFALGQKKKKVVALKDKILPLPEVK